jgi:hypothetical protein
MYTALTGLMKKTVGLSFPINPSLPPGLIYFALAALENL